MLCMIVVENGDPIMGGILQLIKLIREETHTYNNKINVILINPDQSARPGQEIPLAGY